MERDQILREKMDGSAPDAKLPWQFPVALHAARSLPSQTPNKWERSGTPAETWVRLPACIREEETAELLLVSGSFFALGFPYLQQRLLHHLKRFGDLGLKLLEIRSQQRGFRIDDHIHPRWWMRFLQPDRLAEPAFHSISLYGAAKYLPDREAHSKIRGFTCGKTITLPAQVKNRQVGRKITSSLFIDAIKIRMPQ